MAATRSLEHFRATETVTGRMAGEREPVACRTRSDRGRLDSHRMAKPKQGAGGSGEDVGGERIPQR